MTKQEIIDIIKSKCIPIHDDVVGYDFDWAADMILQAVEQEKKEQAREIFEKLYPCISRGAVTYTIWAKDIEEITKEYGVEL